MMPCGLRGVFALAVGTQIVSSPEWFHFFGAFLGLGSTHMHKFIPSQRLEGLHLSGFLLLCGCVLSGTVPWRPQLPWAPWNVEHCLLNAETTSSAWTPPPAQHTLDSLCAVNTVVTSIQRKGGDFMVERLEGSSLTSGQG